MAAIPFGEAFEVLKDRESYLRKVTEERYSSGIILGQILLMCLFTFFYGLIMGSYNSLPQALISGIKLLILFFLTLIVCFPSFYIVQLILGSKVGIKQLAVILLSGFVMTTTVMLAFAPIVLFFQMSGDNYHFLQLLHVFIFVFAGFFGMRLILESLKSAFEETGVYPKIGLIAFRIWVLIFAFVGIQLSWNLRPFLGSKDMKFELFRSETQGNFYSTIFGAFGSMLGIDGSSFKKRRAKPDVEQEAETGQKQIQQKEQQQELQHEQNSNNKQTDKPDAKNNKD
ncbi:MAG TPA: hypothetical protein ENK52_04930 [Saprospiraceae bacterium]|nr:hypothetical protein [Saprospiraceae bacterium]